MKAMGAAVDEDTTEKLQASVPTVPDLNLGVATKLREYADLLVQQGEGGFRSRAYYKAADVTTALKRPLNEILTEQGRMGLVALPGIGYGIAAAIIEILTSGHWNQLARLRGDLAPEILFRTIPGIGPKLADRLADEGHVESLEDLEYALHFGDLAVKGIGERRKRMIASALAERLGRPTVIASGQRTAPSVSLLLNVDRMYREKAAVDQLPKIAPRRFNPKAETWLPIMHIRRNGWYFTALYSNSRLAHELNKTHDWVVIHYQRDSEPEGRCTVVTETHGPMAGRRIVRGREAEQEEKESQT
ncbi:helix-hairpin-helix domain-containing protein [Neorhizobium petrolearium]|uniref:Helix-hairpin-helix domain-containing protein n=1 Tax=Neorhizobium petrolearium TaxID=515361 RepID=A0ABY8M0J0_9HYPH|nr:helix-hairpin-helix domain-containing protein [Neorhizobium petrolearium]MCC2612983.1 DNA-binding protein [Neorhizobium petrolearium]WGI68086.1 helix-hairpin-helix domain-containing protein [Neorhizobium petrolearium]